MSNFLVVVYLPFFCMGSLSFNHILKCKYFPTLPFLIVCTKWYSLVLLLNIYDRQNHVGMFWPWAAKMNPWISTLVPQRWFSFFLIRFCNVNEYLQEVLSHLVAILVMPFYFCLMILTSVFGILLPITSRLFCCRFRFHFWRFSDNRSWLFVGRMLVRKQHIIGYPSRPISLFLCTINYVSQLHRFSLGKYSRSAFAMSLVRIMHSKIHYPSLLCNLLDSSLSHWKCM